MAIRPARSTAASTNSLTEGSREHEPSRERGSAKRRRKPLGDAQRPARPQAEAQSRSVARKSGTYGNSQAIDLCLTSTASPVARMSSFLFDSFEYRQRPRGKSRAAAVQHVVTV